MKSKILLAVAAAAIAFVAMPAANAGKAKPHKHYKSHHIKGWKKCKGTFQYLEKGKCLDARHKKPK